ncbi:MAG: hypothetical protein AABX54_03330 [Nanoarchaeota archaeon]
MESTSQVYRQVNAVDEFMSNGELTRIEFLYFSRTLPQPVNTSKTLAPTRAEKSALGFTRLNFEVLKQ